MSVPFVMRALGQVQFGAWATLVSLVTFAGFLDFGLGNGVMNLIADAHGRGAVDQIQVIMREGRRALTWIALVLAVGILAMLPMVPWHSLLGLPATMGGQSRAAAAVVLLSVAFAVPMSLANRIQLGLGCGDRAFRWQAFGQLLALGLVIVAALSRASLAVITFATVAPPLFSSTINTVLLWRKRTTGSIATRDHEDEIRSRIRREGFLFFILQLAAALAFAADLPLISALRGPIEAGNYAIVQRLFSIIPLGLGLIWAPLWPIYRHALAAGNQPWVNKTLRHSIKLATIAALFGGILIAIAFGKITVLWTHRSVMVSQLLLAGFVVWCLLDGIGGAIGTFLNAASAVRFQVAIAVVFGPACFLAKMLALRSLSITVVPWITASFYLAITLIPLAVFWRKLMRNIFAKAC